MATNSPTTNQHSLPEKTLLFTIEEAAKMQNLKISRLRSAIFKKEISYVKLGALIRFRSEDLSRFINENIIPTRAL